MTHDELLAEIDSYAYNYKPKSALRAVVELHKPQDITLPNGDWGANCTECDGWEYPCPTIQAIEKELK
jgi:hypothetical protein